MRSFKIIKINILLSRVPVNNSKKKRNVKRIVGR